MVATNDNGDFRSTVGLQALGSLASSAINMWSSNKANRSQRESARETEAFQERMSNTAYTRQFTDMKNAGINPILGYANGGASTPSGSSYGAQGGQTTNPLEGMDRMLANESTVKQQRVQDTKTSADTVKTKEDTKKSAAETLNVQQNTEVSKKQIELMNSQIRGNDTTTRKSTPQADHSETPIGKNMPMVQDVAKLLGMGGNTAITGYIAYKALKMLWQRTPLGKVQKMVKRLIRQPHPKDRVKTSARATYDHNALDKRANALD